MEFECGLIFHLKKRGGWVVGVLQACQLCVHQHTPVAEERGLPAAVLDPDSCAEITQDSTKRKGKCLQGRRENDLYVRRNMSQRLKVT